jgi:methyltransferase (TIGR00027 family)
MSVDDDLDPVATTARLTAAMRAHESARPDRLFVDPYAEPLAGEQGMAMLAHPDVAEAGSAITIRTPWIDERITAAVRAGVDQVVLVAAGMDTRAWRLESLAGTTLWELDRPELLALKGRLLDAEPIATRTALPVDLTGDWPAALRAAGHDPDRPTVWLAEGLLQYLPEPDVGRLLDTITAKSAPGSHLVIDLLGAALLAAMSGTPMLQRFAEQGMPWVFGTDDPDGLLASRGWSPTTVHFRDAAAAVGRPSPSGTEGPDGYLVSATR